MPRRPIFSPTAYAEGIKKGDRVLLGQAITLVESTRAENQAIAREIIALLLQTPNPKATLRVGITGAPGAGKSTFIEALGRYLIGQGKRIAVLAIDPSSTLSKGSILGDKTRMEFLSAHDQAFIRPSPSGDTLGGVARKTRETILLVEAAGYDIVFIETVGVGQSETAVHSMTDLFMLLLLPGAGDELQGIKRGIVEMADILVVNKADGERVKLANLAKAHYLNATHLLPLKPSLWSPLVLSCSALQQTGVAQVWESVEQYVAFTTNNGFFEKNRQQQAKFWFKEALLNGLHEWFFKHPEVAGHLDDLEKAVLEGKISPFAAAEKLLDGI
jgi:LAO/AO transport system kinase